MKKFTVVLAVSLVSVLVLMTACTKKSKEKFVLNVGYSGSLCEAPVHVAYELGYLRDEGVEVEIFKLAPGTQYDALTAGKIDASFSLLASIIPPLSNGLPAKITSGLHTGCDVVLVKPNSGIKKAEDLKGKKVGISSMTASPAVYAKRVLADNGIDIRTESSEVEFAIYNLSDLPIVLKNGTVDAIAMNEPTATIARNEYGYVALFDSAVDEPYKDQYCCVSYVSNRLVEKHKDIAEKYTRAIQKASVYIQEHPEEITKIQIDKNYIAGTADINAKIIQKFIYIPSVSGAYNQFGIVAPQLQEIGMVSKDVDVVALQKNSFAFFKGLDAKYK